jgi:branched-chain amino acid transport system permease protein
MDLLYKIFVDPFLQMGTAPDLLVQTLWEGLVAGVLYSLIALGFVLIFKASGVFNFAQGIMVVFAALTLVGLHEHGIPAYLALALTILVMLGLAFAVERLILRPLVNQPDIILFMATFGLTYFLIGFGELIFGGETKIMIANQLGLPRGAIDLKLAGGFVSIQKIDVAAAIIASIMVAGLAIFFQRTRIGRALRAVADSHRAALSVGISLEQIWVIVWFAAGLVALTTGIMWGARSDVSFALDVIALKALPVLILGGLTSIPGAIVGGLIIGIGEKLGEFYWGPLMGSGIESWFAYVIALIFLLFVRKACSASGSSSGSDHALPRGRSIQVELRGRCRDLPDSARSDRACRYPVYCRGDHSLVRQYVPDPGCDDSVSDFLARGHRTEFADRLYRPAFASERALSWVSAPMPVTNLRLTSPM